MAELADALALGASGRNTVGVRVPLPPPIFMRGRKMLKSLTWLDVEAIDRFGTLCTACKKPLEFETTGMQKTSEGYMCDDCYFERLGEEVEKHPLGGHKRVR